MAAGGLTEIFAPREIVNGRSILTADLEYVPQSVYDVHTDSYELDICARSES